MRNERTNHKQQIAATPLQSWSICASTYGQETLGFNPDTYKVNSLDNFRKT